MIFRGPLLCGKALDRNPVSHYTVWLGRRKYLFHTECTVRALSSPVEMLVLPCLAEQENGAWLEPLAHTAGFAVKPRFGSFCQVRSQSEARNLCLAYWNQPCREIRMPHSAYFCSTHPCPTLLFSLMVWGLLWSCKLYLPGKIICGSHIRECWALWLHCGEGDLNSPVSSDHGALRIQSTYSPSYWLQATLLENHCCRA